MRIEAIDLFCGIGGLTNGVQNSGIKVNLGIDFDETCKSTYEVNNNTAFMHEDIKKISGEALNLFWNHDNIRVLMGCAPCQPFSSHQKDKKNREKHKDWGLLYEFVRLVKESEPDIVSMENVPALKREVVFLEFVEMLKELGYFVTYDVFDASKYGVPQRRKRLLLLASKFGEISFLEPEDAERVTVRQAISNLQQIDAGGVSPDDPLHTTSRLSPVNLERIRNSIPGGTWQDWPEYLLLDCHKKESGKTYKSVYGRMNWDDVAPTITTQFTSYGTGRFGHPEQDRAISLREGALLQSFPENYKFFEDINLSKGDIERHIGNAVPPKLGELIGKSIKEHLKKLDRNKIME